MFFRKHVRLFLKTRTCFFEVILTLPMKYISYVQRRYTSSGIDVYLRKKACHPRLFVLSLSATNNMRMKKNIVTLLALIHIILISCDGIGHPIIDFWKVENLMPQHPDSALMLLEQIEKKENLSGKDKAHYYLLLTEAEDKTRAKHASDSLITIATDYYENTDDSKRKAKAWYYRGRVNQDLNLPLKAQEYYLKALRDEEQITDHALLGRINNHIGMLYTYQEVYDKALPFQKKAVEDFRTLRDSMGQVFALRDLGRTFSMLGYRDSAIISNQKAIALMGEKILPSVYTELASLYMRDKRIEEAYELLQRSLQNVAKPQAKYPVYLVLGQLYKESGQIDSAHFYLQACADSTQSPTTRAGGFFHLKEIALAQKQWEQAALLSKQYESLRDSIEKEQRTKLIRKNQALYDYTEIERELCNMRLYASDMKYRYTIFIIGFLVVLCGIILYFIHYTQKKKILVKQLEENESQIRKNKQTIQELSTLRDSLLQDTCTNKDNQELAQTKERLENLSRIKKRLEQEVETLNNKCLALSEWKKNREDLLKQFQATQLYHNFHSPADWKPTEEDWNTLFASVDGNNPGFAIALEKSNWLNASEKKICYLTKIKVKPTMIGILLDLENASIYRRRLYEKLTGSRGSTKDFDKYIADL